MHQDYILRMIQQLGGFITAVLQLRKSGRSAEAIQQIEDAYGRFSGLSATLVHAISEDDLVKLLRARGGLDPDRCWALAELLREEALAYDDLGQGSESAPRFLKSLRLYLEVLEEVDDLPDVARGDRTGGGDRPRLRFRSPTGNPPPVWWTSSNAPAASTAPKTSSSGVSTRQSPPTKRSPTPSPSTNASASSPTTNWKPAASPATKSSRGSNACRTRDRSGVGGSRVWAR